MSGRKSHQQLLMDWMWVFREHGESAMTPRSNLSNWPVGKTGRGIGVRSEKTEGSWEKESEGLI